MKELPDIKQLDPEAKDARYSCAVGRSAEIKTISQKTEEDLKEFELTASQRV